MSQLLKSILAATLFGLPAGLSVAEEQEQEGQDPGTIKFYWENDGFFHDPFDSYDRHYTNGIALVYEHQPGWADDIVDAMPLASLFEKNHGEAQTGAGLLLAQLMFTPADLANPAPITTDQPFAGYLYGGAYWQREGGYYGRDDIAVLDHFEINLGVVGGQSYAEDLQEWVHDHISGVDQQGWDNQLTNEVTGQFFFRRKWRWDIGRAESSLLGGLDMQVIPQMGVALGSVYRHADAAVTFRIGHQLPDDFGPGRINDLESVTGKALHHGGWSWYVFTRVGGRIVEHDMFLDGSNYNDPSLSVKKEPLVGEVQAGLSVGYAPNANNRFDLNWGLTYHSDTFDAPGDRGTESYGTFVLSWTREH